MSESTARGYGIFRVSPVIIEEFVDHTSYRVEKGVIHYYEQSIDLKEKFLLPDGYTVETAYFDVYRRQWVVIVQSADIPIVEEGSVLPDVSPTYSRTAEGVVSIVKITIT
jgi:hypothetical protein